MGLLAEDEPPPFRTEDGGGNSQFLFTADHAGRLIPRRMGTLGLGERELTRHIAWDIGIGGVTTRLAAKLGAPAVYQNYSRLVIDCNRHPSVASAFPEISEATKIPGNLNLSAEEKTLRQQALFDPYHQEIAARVAARRGAGMIYVAMHSFTPVYLGVRRAMDVAVLYHRAPRFSKALAELLRLEGDVVVAENEPYRVSDETDYGVPVHAERNGLDYVEIEIRQDLIETSAGQEAWAARLARLLPLAAARLEG
jgi:predicted N-formylglutamate amidohydrolase